MSETLAVVGGGAAGPSAVTASGFREQRGVDPAYTPPCSPVWDPIPTAATVLGGEVDP